MVGLTGTVLAGGKSRRFGTNKALYLYDGKSLLQQSLDILRPFCDQLYISANNSTAATYRDMGADIICDLHPDCGPIGGIEAIVNVCQTDHLLVLTCDMPLVTTDILLSMITASHLGVNEYHDSLPSAVAWQSVDGSIMPFPLLLHKNSFQAIGEQIKAGDLKMKHLLMRIGCKLLPIVDDRYFANINRLNDFKK